MGAERLILQKIKENGDKVTKSQKRVADFLLDNVDRVVYMTAAQIGMEAGVSETTVIRFAMSLGYKKYSELQDEFRKEFSNSRTLQRLQQASDEMGEQSILVQSFRKDMDNIQKTLDRLDEREFEQIISLICEAKDIYTIGHRSSTSDAFFLGFSLNVLLGNAKPVTTLGIDLENTLRFADENSVVIAFTYPRYTMMTLESVLFLKNEKKAKIISITDSVESPVIPYSDHVLLASIGSYTPIDSHVAGFTICNAIISAVGQKEKERAKQNLHQLEQYFNKVHVFHQK